MRFALLRIAPFKAGLSSLLAQNLILMGVFFAIPLYLQIVLGLDALDTGVRMLPTSIVMLVVSFLGGALLKVLSPRAIIRLGLAVLMVAAIVLLATIQPDLQGTTFALAMGLLGGGMGLMASQLGNVVQSSVGPEARSEAGGLQFTAQQLGSSLGVALIGSVVLTGLVGAYLSNIAGDPAVADSTVAAVEVQVSSGSSFVPADQVAAAVADAGYTGPEATALVDNYADAQLTALKTGMLAVVLIAGLAFGVTGDLPAGRRDELDARASDTGTDVATA